MLNSNEKEDASLCMKSLPLQKIPSTLRSITNHSVIGVNIAFSSLKRDEKWLQNFNKYPLMKKYILG